MEQRRQPSSMRLKYHDKVRIIGYIGVMRTLYTTALSKLTDGIILFIPLFYSYPIQRTYWIRGTLQFIHYGNRNATNGLNHTLSTYEYKMNSKVSRELLSTWNNTSIGYWKSLYVKNHTYSLYSRKQLYSA